MTSKTKTFAIILAFIYPRIKLKSSIHGFPKREEGQADEPQSKNVPKLCMTTADKHHERRIKKKDETRACIVSGSGIR